MNCRIPRTVLVLMLLLSTPAMAWIYPEHRDIAATAIQKLSPEERDAFGELWQLARQGEEQRLCPELGSGAYDPNSPCIDWAALSAIAGDHSCSSRDLLHNVTETDWILQVADVAEILKTRLADIPISIPAKPPEQVNNFMDAVRERLAGGKNRAARVNALRTADLHLQRADPQYATRADANLAHFLLPRPSTRLKASEYALLTMSPGSDLNAVGVYAWFHISALQKASRMSDPGLSEQERSRWARAALFDEAFALHFLQDTFASGHVAGSWGDVSQRKGTHDYYNQVGLEVFTWQGREQSMVLMGDAHMRTEDLDRAALVIRASLQQVLAQAQSEPEAPDLPRLSDTAAETDPFDVCVQVTFPRRPVTQDSQGFGPYGEILAEVLLNTPVPGLGPGLGALPRSRSEVGPFMGLAGSLDSRFHNGSFVSSHDGSGSISGLDIGFRGGMGLEGTMGDSGDGLVFAQLGLRADTASTNRAQDTALEGLGGSLSAAIPARAGISTRIRMPFYLLPGDLFLLSPLYFHNPETYTQMAVTAANGGLIPWQQAWATRIGRFQFVLGREMGVTFYGVIGDTQLAAPSTTPGGIGRVVEYKSTYFDLPVLEYRPFRMFSSNQSSSVIFQLFAGADVPSDESVKSPVMATPVELDTLYSVGLRMVFDWRYYE